MSATYEGQIASASNSTKTAMGHHLGEFHSSILRCLSSGSIFMYCSVLRTICVGLALPTHC
ncbi:hypothetical protein D3C85_1718460 [compost metagenome]